MPFGFPNVGGSSHPGAVASVDSIEAVGVKLTTVDASGFNDGDLIYVGNETFAGQGSIKDYVRVRRNASLTPTEGEVWNSATTGVQFERLHTPSASQLQRVVWSVTNDNGLGTAIIDNDGFGAHPVSMREVNRRRAGDSQGIGSSIFIQVPDMSSPARPELLACTLSNWWGTDGNASPVILGIVAANLYAGTVVSFTAANQGAGTGYILQAVGIGAAFESVPGIVQALVQLSTLGKTAVIQGPAIDADHVRISQPRTSDPSGFNVGSVTTFAPGNSIIIPNLPALPVMPYVPGAFQFFAIGEMDLTGFDGEFNSCDFGNGSPYILNCLINSVQIKGGAGTGAVVAGFRGNNNLSNVRMNLWSCAMGQGLNVEAPVTGHLTAVGTNLQCIDNLDANDCIIDINGGRIQAFNDFSCFGFNGSAAAMVRVQSNGMFGVNGNWWGGVTSPNGCRLGLQSAGGRIDVPAANVLVTTASSPDDFNVVDGGPGIYPRGAISIANPMGGGVFDATILRSVGAATFTGALVTSAGGATTSFMANPGTLLALANQTSAQQFPANRRIIRSLTVVKLATTAGVDIVYTVYIAGGTVPTAMTVTVLSTDPVGTSKTYNAIPIILGSPQSCDVRQSAGVDVAPGTALASALVQFG